MKQKKLDLKSASFYKAQAEKEKALHGCTKLYEICLQQAIYFEEEAKR